MAFFSHTIQECVLECIPWSAHTHACTHTCTHHPRPSIHSLQSMLSIHMPTSTRNHTYTATYFFVIYHLLFIQVYCYLFICYLSVIIYTGILLPIYLIFISYCLYRYTATYLFVIYQLLFIQVYCYLFQVRVMRASLQACNGAITNMP